MNVDGTLNLMMLLAHRFGHNQKHITKGNRNVKRILQKANETEKFQSENWNES